MNILRACLGAACIALALTTCGKPDGGAASQPALPTADVVTPPNIAQVIPLTLTPAPTEAPPTPESTTLAASPAATIVVAKVQNVDSQQTPASSPPPALDPAAVLEAELIVEINKVRQANGLPPYTASPELSAAARAHSC